MIPKKDKPVLLDTIIQELQELQEKNLKWLDFAFGRSYKIEAPKEDKIYKFPAVYTGNNEYMSVLPDDSLGNFSYIELEDPNEIDNTTRSPRLSIRGAIIFWLNTETVYVDKSVLYNEEIKAEIFRMFKSCHLASGRLTILNLYENAENIYKGYDIKQINGQYLISPYYGLRVEIKLNISELCLNP